MNPIYFTLVLSLLMIGCSETASNKAPEKEATKVTITKEDLRLELVKAKKELSQIHSTPYLETYITKVINEGSKGLGFPGGDMQGGFAAKQDAADIARYVTMMTGQKSSDDAKGSQAAIFYSSNCGGCHGNDGKGLNGSFPDLTTLPYKGIIKNEERLHVKIKELTSALAQNP